MDRDEEMMYSYLDGVEESQVTRGSCSAGNLMSIFILALYKKDIDLFKSAVTKLELVMLNNRNFFKPLANLVHFFCFYLAEKYDKDLTLKFYEAISYLLWKFATVNLKNYFEAVFEANEEYDGDESAKKMQGIQLQTLDLIVGVISKTPSSKLKYLDCKVVGDLFATL